MKILLIVQKFKKSVGRHLKVRKLSINTLMAGVNQLLRKNEKLNKGRGQN